MTNEQKIQMLTGAIAALIDRNDSYFYQFTKIEQVVAKEFVTNAAFKMGVSAGGNLWVADDSYRWIFADESLAEIANA